MSEKYDLNNFDESYDESDSSNPEYDGYGFDVFDEKPLHKPKQLLKSKAKSVLKSNGAGRKGLKWTLIGLWKKRLTKLIALALAVLIFIIILVSACSNNGSNNVQETATQPTTVKPVKTDSTSYKINGVPIILQADLLAGCETYACTMLLQYYKYDISEYEFVDKYLLMKPVYYDSYGTKFGPDMNSAFAGDIYEGYGINAPAMAKCMNKYLKEQTPKRVATPIMNSTLEELCQKYVKNGIPAMVWITGNMQEPYDYATWVVDYADSDSPVKVGDEVSWQAHEHCVVLIGYDKDNYYFCDSIAGEVTCHEKKTFGRTL